MNMIMLISVCHLFAVETECTVHVISVCIQLNTGELLKTSIILLLALFLNSMLEYLRKYDILLLKSYVPLSENLLCI